MICGSPFFDNMNLLVYYLVKNAPSYLRLNLKPHIMAFSPLEHCIRFLSCNILLEFLSLRICTVVVVFVGSYN